VVSGGALRADSGEASRAAGGASAPASSSCSSQPASSVAPLTMKATGTSENNTKQKPLDTVKSPPQSTVAAVGKMWVARPAQRPLCASPGTISMESKTSEKSGQRLTKSRGQILKAPHKKSI
jgi:hypothetical protein